MATLAFGQQRLLPPPRPPRRSKLPDTDVALRHLGFDAGFDLSMQCKADAITTEEVLVPKCACGTLFNDGEKICRHCCADRAQLQIERRLLWAVDRLKGHTRRATLPWACLELRKMLVPPDGKQEDKKASRDEECGDPKLKLAEKVAQTVGVDAADVLVEVSSEAVQCIVQVTRPGASIIGCQQLLAIATKDRGGGLERGDPSGIHRSFAEAGAVEDLSLRINVSWSTERAIEEVNLLHPGYVLDDLQLQEILQSMDEARNAFSLAWNEIEKEENEPATKLIGMLPMGRFIGDAVSEMMHIEDGFSSGLFSETTQQDASNLRSLIETALEAHSNLKSVLAPNSAWSVEAMHDLVEIPYEHDCRRYASNPWDLIPEALLVDPGLKSEKHLFEKAKWCQTPQQIAPPFMDLMDVSRITLIFKSCEDLAIGLKRLQDKFEVVFFENRFLFPSCMGHRCATVGVRQTLPSGASHISKLVLEHRAIFEIKETASDSCMKRISASLTRSGFAAREVANIRRIVFQQLALTKGEAIRKQEQELLQAFTFALSAKTSMQSTGTELCQQLVEEAINQALAAGVSENRIMAASSRLQLSEFGEQQNREDGIADVR